MNKCDGCIFEGEFRDMGASMEVCDRCGDLMEAIKAHSDAGPCKWYITKEMLIKLQEDMLNET